MAPHIQKTLAELPAVPAGLFLCSGWFSCISLSPTACFENDDELPCYCNRHKRDFKRSSSTFRKVEVAGGSGRIKASPSAAFFPAYCILGIQHPQELPQSPQTEADRPLTAATPLL